MSDKIKILILEHDQNDIDLIENELKQIGVDYVSMVARSEKQYEMALNDQPDIILSDYALPSFNGLDAFKIREDRMPDTPFIFVSGTIGEELATEHFRNGVTDFVLKDKLFTLNPKIVRALKEVKDQKEKGKAERELVLSEARLARAQAISKIGSWETDLTDFSVLWSDETYRIFGVDRKNFKASHKNFLKLIHPEDVSKVEAAFMASLENKSINTFEHRIITPDGIIKCVEECWQILHNENGGPFRAMGTCQDITERVNIEERRKFEKRDKEALINNTDDLIWSVSKDYKLIAYNTAFIKAMFSVTQTTFETGLDLLNLSLPADMLLNWKKLYDRVLSGESVKSEIYSPAINTWPEAWSETSLNPIYERDEVIAAACHSRNITEQRVAQRELAAKSKIIEEREHRYRTLFEQNLAGFYQSSPSGEIMDCNDAFARMLKYNSAEDLLHTNVSELYFSSENRRALLSDLIAKRKLNNYEGVLKCRDGSPMYFLANISVQLHAESGMEYFDGILIDITDRRNAEVNLNESHERLTENKLAIIELNNNLKKQTEELAVSNEELERFAYVASHDLQEPLRMVTSFLQLLQKKYALQLDETAQKYINFAVDGAARMKNLILDLLEFSRVSSVKVPHAIVSLDEVLVKTLHGLKTAIDESGAVITVSSLPVIRGNEFQLIQLFQNLISNAIKYKSDNKPRIEISYTESTSGWTFLVKDNGIGIDPKFQEKVFIIFQRLHNKSAFMGTGIGLAICKKIVELHGGKIWLECENDGTTFYFTLNKQIHT